MKTGDFEMERVGRVGVVMESYQNCDGGTWGEAQEGTMVPGGTGRREYCRSCRS